MMDVTQSNFDELVGRVKAGLAVFYVPTYARCTVINDKCFARFEKAGKVPIRKDMSGRGFRLASGRSMVYVFEGGLKVK